MLDQAFTQTFGQRENPAASPEPRRLRQSATHGIVIPPKRPAMPPRQFMLGMTGQTRIDHRSGICGCSSQAATWSALALCHLHPHRRSFQAQGRQSKGWQLRQWRSANAQPFPPRRFPAHRYPANQVRNDRSDTWWRNGSRGRSRIPADVAPRVWQRCYRRQPECRAGGVGNHCQIGR